MARFEQDPHTLRFRHARNTFWFSLAGSGASACGRVLDCHNENIAFNRSARAHYSPPVAFPTGPVANQLNLRNDLSQTPVRRPVLAGTAGESILPCTLAVLLRAAQLNDNTKRAAAPPARIVSRQRGGFQTRPHPFHHSRHPANATARPCLSLRLCNELFLRFPYRLSTVIPSAVSRPRLSRRSSTGAGRSEICCSGFLSPATHSFARYSAS